MQLLFRALGGVVWRVAFSILAFHACTSVGEAVQHSVRGAYHMPLPWEITITLCFYTFCLLAIGLATATQAMARIRIRPCLWLAAGCSIYAGVTLFLFGAFFGDFEGPYRLLFVLACGLSGLVAPGEFAPEVGENFRCS